MSLCVFIVFCRRSAAAGAPVWTRATQSPHTLKRNRRKFGPDSRESSFYSAVARHTVDEDCVLLIFIPTTE